MGQKLGLAACLLSNKVLMVFDEPMSGLDPRARALLKRCLLELKQQGKTLFYSTHLLEDVVALCDRVIILHDGNICFSGTPRECCARYKADNFEAAYLACVGG
jgi:ABC-2 type transport system ATP-binding protein